MNNEIMEFNSNQVEAKKSNMVEVEQSRVTQEIQAALVIAKKFPRDINLAFTKIMQSCQRLSFAERALYTFPKGKVTVSGASIRLAELIAQNYGNIDFGIRELERKQGCSIAESYCWDMENNTRTTKRFEVPHEIGTKASGIKKLIDPRDIYEIVANNGARRLRACILGIVPKDIEDAAVEQCRKTIAKGGGKPIEDRIRDMLIAFKDHGVSQEMIETRLGHSVSLITVEELVDLTGIFTTIRDKQAKRGDFFDFPEDDTTQSASKASEVLEKLKKKGPVITPKEAPTDPEAFDNFK